MQSIRQRLINLGAAAVIAGSGAFIAVQESPGGKPNLTPYDDIGGVPTWCYGETLGTPKARYTVAECDVELIRSVHRHWQGISLYVPQEAPQSVKEAMLSVAYNVGVSGWKSPVLLKPLAAHDWEAVCLAISAPWKGKHGVAKGFKATVQGKPVRGIELRRQREAALCRRDL